MSEEGSTEIANGKAISFFDRPNVQKETIPLAGGIPMGIESVFNAELGIGGAYGAWGASYDNRSLSEFVGQHLGEPLEETDIMNLAELGFVSRHHSPYLNKAEHLELELEVGTRLVRHALHINGWDPTEVQGLLIGMSAPVSDDYVPEIAHRAGIPDGALKVSVHKACDGSMGALHLALNPELSEPGQVNIAEELRGKKVLVGGIEGLSRQVSQAHDKYALQLFGNGAGMIGVIPGETMKFLVGKTFENYDEEGMLKVRMNYPHSGKRVPGKSMLEVSQAGPEHVRIAGLMHEPEDDAAIEMAGLMGMVKLFVRSGVEVVSDVFQEYQAMMDRLGKSGKSIQVAIVHHANYKINMLKAKQLAKIGIQFPMPWLISDFGNVSAASNMIAFLRQLPSIKVGDHVLFDGFGAGTYYDVMAIAFG
jgi:3-oxoacyl-[acyl-carrier-protein] synthase III